MGGIFTKWPEKAGGVVGSWGNYALKATACRWAANFNWKPIWLWLARFSSERAYVDAAECGVPRLRELFAKRGLAPIEDDVVYVHFRCSDVPFIFHSQYPLPRAEFLEYAMGVARARAPGTRRVVLESCGHHKSLNGRDLEAPKANQVVCARFATELRDYMAGRWPDYTFDLVCHPEAESVRRMLGARVLIMTVPSSFAFTSGVQKGKDFVTPKLLGEPPKWDTRRLQEAVPWSMYPGVAGTDVLAPVEQVPNYYQFDFARFLASGGAIATRDGGPWRDWRPHPQREYATALAVVVVAALAALAVVLAVQTFRPRGRARPRRPARAARPR